MLRVPFEDKNLTINVYSAQLLFMSVMNICFHEASRSRYITLADTAKTHLAL